MRTSPLRDRLAAAGAVFRERHGVEVAAHFGDVRAECGAVREAVALADFSFVRGFTLPETPGIDFLDALLAGNVPKIRFGRLLHTFLADADGRLAADCFVANNDQEFVLLAESILPDEPFDALLASAGIESPAKDLTGDHVVLILDGVKSWEIVKKLFGADVIGLPYLSIENYEFAGEPVRFIRAGKTSEFGYLLVAPVAIAAQLFDTLKAEVEARGGRLAGTDAHDALRLEGRFFNIFREGARVRDPLPLGLQWMVDFDKEKFLGSDAIKQRRLAGLKQKIIGLVAGADCTALKTGVKIFHDGQPVGEVVADCLSYVLNRPLALGLFPVELAFSGLSFHVGSADGPMAQSISMPPIMPRSLAVKLDEM
ncbi:MAG TPA: glycine cleavage T C-terminal barrel domain-containing protein [Verrucomicrobiae bacterium]|nr:glycine cleavage T C-terminal barrel domain-containing protein [Verrucomicrobiae bacterium]